MRNIKTLFLSCLFMLLAFSSYAQEMLVGEIKNDPRGDTYPIIGQDKIKEMWEKELREKNISAELVEFNILPVKASKCDEILYYMMQATSSTKNVKMASIVKRRGAQLYMTVTSAGTWETVICTSKATTLTCCNPFHTAGYWQCTESATGSNEECKSCVKMVTVRDEQ